MLSHRPPVPQRTRICSPPTDPRQSREPVNPRVLRRRTRPLIQSKSHHGLQRNQRIEIAVRFDECAQFAVIDQRRANRNAVGACNPLDLAVDLLNDVLVDDFLALALDDAFAYFAFGFTPSSLRKRAPQSCANFSINVDFPTRRRPRQVTKEPTCLCKSLLSCSICSLRP